MNANAAARSLLSLEDSLNVSTKDHQNNLNEVPLGSFQSLLLKDVTYEYKKIDATHNYFLDSLLMSFYEVKLTLLKEVMAQAKQL